VKVKKLPFEKFKEIYTQVPRLCVEVVIQTPNGILLTKRGIEPYIGYWHLPGGTVLLGETIRQAIKRIAKEEVGVKVEVLKLLNYIEYPDESRVRGYGQSIGFAFLAKVVSGKIPKTRNGEKIAIYHKLPKKIIKDQEEFLEKLLNSPDFNFPGHSSGHKKKG